MMGRTGKLLILGLVLAAGMLAQEPEGAKPLSEAEFVTLVNAKTPPEQIVAEIRARGIAFELTPKLEEGLKSLQLEVLIEALTEPARVELRSNAAGAEVTVDGEKREPVSAQGEVGLSGLAPGTHIIQLRAEDYVSDSVQLFLKPGETRQVELELRAAVVATPGPLGTQVSVQAGTTADAALAELEFAKEPEERLPLLQKLVERYAESPLALLGYAQLQETYLQAEQFDNAIAAGENILQRDPRNFAARVRQVRASAGKGDLEKGFEYAAQASQLVEELPAAPPPEGITAESWESEKRDLLKDAQGELRTLAYTLFAGASQVADPARKVALLERFVEMFPASDYLGSALMQLALASQQRGDAEASLRWADRGLELNPDQGILLMLAADVLSERGQNLAKARALAAHLLELLSADPEKVRPEGLPEEQWASLRPLWEGTGHSVLGQVLLHEGAAQPAREKEITRRAVTEFRAASPLLKGQPQLYARNLYRLGFAHQKLGELALARDVLTEAAALESPYRPLAQDLLAKVKQALARRRR